MFEIFEKKKDITDSKCSQGFLLEYKIRLQTPKLEEYVET